MCPNRIRRCADYFGTGLRRFTKISSAWQLASVSMADLPSGEVSFLFTDIEGSTRLQHRLGEDYRALVRRHDRLLQLLVSRHGGHVVKSMGDGVFAAFGSADDALAAGAAIQRALRDERWPGDVLVRTRIGIDTGLAVPQDDDYTSLAVNRAARVMTAANGDQILLTPSVAERLTSALSATVTPLGRFVLKDFDEPVMLLRAGLNDRPPRVPQARANNVPAMLTSYVGRSRELADLEQYARTSRLVTIAGPGGVGKTRTAFELAHRLAPQFRDGAWLAMLAQVSEPSLVVETIAGALEVRVADPPDLIAGLTVALRERQLALVLDNCEHVLGEVAAVVERIVTECRDVHVIATSREPLGIAGERVFRLDPLPLPPEESDGDVEQYDAVRLFAERVRLRNPSFAVDEHTAAAVGRICREVDGLPLALELVAARVASLGVDAVEGRLERRLSMALPRGSQLTPHHRTLASTLAWSYELLSGIEQIAFRRLAVFHSPFSVDDAAAVLVDDSDDAEVDDAVASLADKSLLMRTSDRPMRFRTLVTVAEFAERELLAAGEAVAVKRRHVRWVLDATAVVPTRPDKPADAGWINLAARMLPEMRAAEAFAATDDLPWSHERLTLAGRAARYAFVRGTGAETRAWAQRVIADVDSPEDDAYGWLVYNAALLFLNVPEVRDALLDRLRAIATPENPDLYASLLHHEADKLREHAPAEAATIYEKARQTTTDPRHRAVLQRMVAVARVSADNVEESLSSAADVRAKFAKLGDEFEVGRSDYLISQLHLQNRDAAAAAAAAASAVEIGARRHFPDLIITGLFNLAAAAHLLGRRDVAALVLGCAQGYAASHTDLPWAEWQQGDEFGVLNEVEPAPSGALLEPTEALTLLQAPASALNLH
ncbi:MAG: adenylate/guanylate cyclase domain-containing protein [Jatrophihabitans sp.]